MHKIVFVINLFHVPLNMSYNQMPVIPDGLSLLSYLFEPLPTITLPLEIFIYFIITLCILLKEIIFSVK